jgi:type I restriction enzyme M protein
MDKVFAAWSKHTVQRLQQLKPGFKPKELIHEISEELLTAYTNKALLDKYDVYQHLMNYWQETMQDDCYIITADGWKAEPYRIIVKNKAGKDVDKGWACDLVPAQLVIGRYFSKEKKELQQLEADKETLTAQLAELEEEHSAEEGFFVTLEKINKATVQKRLKELKEATPKKLTKPVEVLSMAAEDAAPYVDPKEELTEQQVLELYLSLSEKQTQLNSQIKTATEELDKKTLAKYPTLTENEIKQLVINDKWITSIKKAIQTEMERVSQRLTQRIKELAERYDTPLPQHNKEVAALEEKINAHLIKMGFVWN